MKIEAAARDERDEGNTKGNKAAADDDKRGDPD